MRKNSECDSAAWIDESLEIHQLLEVPETELRLCCYGELLRRDSGALNPYLAVLEMDGMRFAAVLHPGRGLVRARLYAGIQFASQTLPLAMEHIRRIEAAVPRDREPIHLKLDLDGNLYGDCTLPMEAEETGTLLGLEVPTRFLCCFRDDFRQLADGSSPRLPPLEQVKRYCSQLPPDRSSGLRELFGLPVKKSSDLEDLADFAGYDDSIWEEDEPGITVLADGTRAFTPPSGSCAVPEDFFQDYDSGVTLVREEEDSPILPSDAEMLAYLLGTPEEEDCTSFRGVLEDRGDLEALLSSDEEPESALEPADNN